MSYIDAGQIVFCICCRMLLNELDFPSPDDPSNIFALWISWHAEFMYLHFAFSCIGLHVFLHMYCMRVWVFWLTSAPLYYCLHCTRRSVDFKRVRHAGTDGGQVGQLRHSSASSSHHRHLNPKWKDNTPQHNAICTYNCLKAAHHRQSKEKNKNLVYFYRPSLFSIPMWMIGIGCN